MKTIKVTNSYDLPITGKPAKTVRNFLDIKTVGVVPSAISLIKPKLLVKEGDVVELGQPLFFDKKDQRITFVSPAGGTVSKVTYGPKRRLDEVQITISSDEKKVDFSSLTNKSIESLTRDDVVKALLAGGLWSRFVEYPFQRIPSPDVVPPALYVSIDYDEPFLPDSAVYMQGKIESFKKGIKILSKLSDKVYVGASSRSQKLVRDMGGVVTHTIEGAYPANDPGVFLYHNKSSVEENASWGIRGMDVLQIAEFFETGVYPTERVITIAGPLVTDPVHALTREGVQVASLIDGVTEPARYIAGGVLTGRSAGESGYLSYGEYGLHVIREGKKQEMFTFFRPGFDKPTYSKTYFSALLRHVRLSMTTSLNGGDRSCISCGECPSVCPVDILPQFAMKSILAGDVEDAIAHGALDCVSCGLCTYVCPSKIDLDSVYSDFREKLAKEA